jgi:Phosphatidylserine/phosphatidylglycerophosphate/cardiolipin synthases and related enzymes
MYRTISLIFILFILVPAGAVMIVEFCPDPYLYGDEDEYLVLEGNGFLDGIKVSDGEGGFRFPEFSRISGKLVVARNGMAYAEVHGTAPDYEIFDSSPGIPDVIRSGNMQLSNTGDELLLYNGPDLRQKISWPGEVSCRQGQVHFLENGVWDPRVLMIGQTRISPALFEDVSGTAFVAPDSSFTAFKEITGSAREEILVNVYEFSSPAMAEELIKAEERGVRVTVLLEGGPVGGISSGERSVVFMMNRSGIPVYQMVNSGSAHAPYRYNHAKYMVIDHRALFLTSENFKTHGFPPEGQSGNRGYGVILYDPALAAYFHSIYEQDIGGNWIVPLAGKEGELEEPEKGVYDVEFEAFSFEGARVTPVISPDTSSLICDLIRGAQESIDIEQAYIKKSGENDQNPFLYEVLNASERGVTVRVLLDSYWFSVEGDDDNDEMVEFINIHARSGNLPLEARCAALGKGDPEKVHNKGVIVDGRKVLVSSINWNLNSPTFNREAGVIIDHPEAGAYFSRVFECDWEAAGNPVSYGGPDVTKIVVALVVIAGLTIFYLFRRKR